ncbi:uncharacterized protein ACLA_059590 [Aspergillus clavatus NRRL 1]|uniref:F-box domain protein n=1 Tax=Aspergillus clavatus (strain ATCC 1007 / CBS 513.65 / DSM 816 / NCTC 3887 / NRRL 1 / QM 1276 / 107) TaxID=344612 RepID=A1C4F2_ASPCL|nr:uncharacterized protein ACLA_059590 [Aspergillus clavatus NRRL 1]EAW15292.1 hypothetical protein ACLA_059590 [Aspergillus clavatus NRRL 1]
MRNCCLLCGIPTRTLSKARIGGVASVRIFSEREEWSKSFKEKGYYVGDVKELQDIYFKIPWIWTRLYRAIHIGPGSFLSGVALSGPWDGGRVQVPWQKNGLLLGDPAHMDGISFYQAETAHCIHDRCWSLLAGYMDADCVLSNLWEFERTLCWTTVSSNSKRHILEEWRWSRPPKCYRALSRTDPGEYARLYADELGCSERRYAPRDPYNIPELLDLFAHPERLQHELIRKPPPRRIRYSRPRPQRSHAMTLRFSGTFDARAIRIPSDILLMILDLLPTYHDLQRFFWVFPQCREWVPLSFWRKRCIKEFLLVEPLPAADALDWHILYFYADTLLAHSHGWQLRKYIIARLESAYRRHSSVSAA